MHDFKLKSYRRSRTAFSTPKGALNAGVKCKLYLLWLALLFFFKEITPHVFLHLNWAIYIITLKSSETRYQNAVYCEDIVNTIT